MNPTSNFGGIGAGRVVHVLMEPGFHRKTFDPTDDDPNRCSACGRDHGTHAGSSCPSSGSLADARARALCGVKGKLSSLELEVDSRAIVVRSRKVCDSCRQLLDRHLTGELSTDIDTGARQPTRERKTMSNSNGASKKVDEVTGTVWAISNKKASIRRALRKPETHKRVPKLEKELAALQEKLTKLRASRDAKKAPKSEARLDDVDHAATQRAVDERKAAVARAAKPDPKKKTVRRTRAAAKK